MARKISVKGLAKAIEESLDASALLQREAHGNNVYPLTVARADRAKKKLDRLLKEINMEAKDGISRRHS